MDNTFTEAGWIEHSGGKCPVAANVAVEVIYACGDSDYIASASAIDWCETGDNAIISYRVAT